MAESTTITAKLTEILSTSVSTDSTSKVVEILKDASHEDVERLTTILFQWYDYLFFGLLLGMSVVIGLYYAFFSTHKQNNTSEYILGGKSMKSLPVAISLVSA